ncbi:Protein phosphatase 1F [Amphibalanus amphitrite]|uniref:Protein phosphatase 1F n=1 Tax=Amphibalanus amphitrite TaxID=1232801 RepID=A0A6A4VK90_AMPAM|nr:Protein phosphatase 1F [Amphibalanus amphitrite]
MATPVLAISNKAVKNKRRKMEDRTVLVHDLRGVTDKKLPDHYGFYGVFDGHIGYDAAAYCTQHMARNLAESPQFPDKPHLAFIDAFSTTDKGFNATGSNAGAAVVAALISSTHLHVAWIGDCQAVLSRAGLPVRVVNPHKPERPDEKARIEQLGGFVNFYGSYRVNGVLSVSRALGDENFRPFVSDRPDVTTVELDGTEDFLLLACDGFFDVIDAEQTVRMVMNDMEENPSTNGERRGEKEGWMGEGGGC